MTRDLAPEPAASSSPAADTGPETGARSAAAPADFQATLYPHRSLGPKGFLILMGFLCLINFGTGLMFWSLGAWPIAGFCGLDVLLVYIAFRVSYRSGRVREFVELRPEALTLTRVDAVGTAQQFSFNPYWVKVVLSEGVDGRTSLGLSSHGRQLPFGVFLTDDERRELAQALRGALARVRG